MDDARCTLAKFSVADRLFLFEFLLLPGDQGPANWCSRQQTKMCTNRTCCSMFRWAMPWCRCKLCCRLSLRAVVVVLHYRRFVLSALSKGERRGAGGNESNTNFSNKTGEVPFLLAVQLERSEWTKTNRTAGRSVVICVTFPSFPGGCSTRLGQVAK